MIRAERRAELYDSPEIYEPGTMNAQLRSGGVLFLIVALLLVGGAGRLAWLERSQGEQLRERAVRQHTARMTIPAQRGDILDARGRVFAGSVRKPSVYMDPSIIRDAPYAAHSIAPVLGMSALEVERMIRTQSDRAFVWLKRELTPEQVKNFQTLRDARQLWGMRIQHEPHRVYPFGSLASQVIGFVGREPNQPGLAGIEQSFHAVLSGAPGQRVSTVDARRRRLAPHPDQFVEPRDGASVVLTLDAHLQQCTENHLRSAVETFKAQWGTAVLIDVRSGEVLAMANWPSFDPSNPIPATASRNDQTKFEDRLRNQAIASSYEPGSIFKPFVGAPALDARLVRLDETYAINGPIRQFGSRSIRDVHPYGALQFREVISKSSNIGMGILGSRCGNGRLHEFVRRFGFGDPTGIDLPGEHAGLLNDFGRWTSFSTQSIPIGQEISVTPIQLVAAFSTLCNDGVLYRPRIVRGVVASDGTLIEDRSRPVAVRRVLSSQAVREFRERALAETVRTGTGKEARIPGYQVFGKTGTAQVARLGGGGYIPGAYVGSFLGGAPLNDPRVAVVVSIYRPSGGTYYGGTVAAPTAGRILADALHYLKVPYELTLDDPQNTVRKRPGAEERRDAAD